MSEKAALLQCASGNFFRQMVSRTLGDMQLIANAMNSNMWFAIAIRELASATLCGGELIVLKIS